MLGKGDRQIIHSLDGLRGIAALIVVELHTSSWFYGWKFPNGQLAVDFFFLLSGFVLARAYDDRLRSGLPVFGFMKARVVRLYPLYLVGIALTTALLLLRDRLNGVGLALAFVFLPNFFSYQNFFWYVPASWSLFFELVVNAAYGFVSRFLTTPVLCAFCVVAAISLIACAQHYHSMDVGYRGRHVWGGFARVLFSFPAGILAYRLRDTVPAIRGAAWPCAIALFGVLIISFPPVWRPFFQAGMAIGVFPIILLLSARAAPSEISSSIFAVLGAISYPIYVLHGSAAGLINLGWKSLGHHKPPHAVMGVSIILALMVACYFLARADEHLRTRIRLKPRYIRPQAAPAE